MFFLNINNRISFGISDLPLLYLIQKKRIFYEWKSNASDKIPQSQIS